MLPESLRRPPWPSSISGPVRATSSSYFTLRPAWFWLGVTLPLAAMGTFALRPRWLCAGLGLWAAALFASEEITALVRLRAACSAGGVRPVALQPRKRGRRCPTALRIVTWNILATPGDIDHAWRSLPGTTPTLPSCRRRASATCSPTRYAASRPLAAYHIVRVMDNVTLSRFPLARTNVPINAERGARRDGDAGRWLLAPVVNVHLPMPTLVTQIVPDRAHDSRLRGIISPACGSSWPQSAGAGCSWPAISTPPAIIHC